MKDLLDSLDKLLPIPTNHPTDYKADKSIKACIFDIYGTLLISSSGDIDLSDVSTEYLTRAFNEAGITVTSKSSQAQLCATIIDYFEECIKESHATSRKNGIPYPEVDIVNIWTKVLNHFSGLNQLTLEPHFDIHHMTSVFEILSNRVYPMPGMKEIIHYLKEKNMPIGIVSNAQFYTPVIMNYYLNDMVSDKEMIELFDPELSVYSYKEKRAKPDPKLFERLLPRLNQLNIKPEETLFVGNDMLKDTYTANVSGFKTVLFTGDKRSLRLREDKKEVKGLSPTYVIDNLLQLKEII